MRKCVPIVVAVVTGCLAAGLAVQAPAAWAGSQNDANVTQDEPADTDIDASTTSTATSTSTSSGRTTGTGKTGTEKSDPRGSASSGRTDQDRAYDAERRGIVLPYGRVLKKVKQAVPGDIVRVRLEQNKSLWTYEVTVLDGEGRYIQLSLNARTGSVISKRRR